MLSPTLSLSVGKKKAIIYLGKGVYGKRETAPASSKVKLTHPPLRHGTFWGGRGSYARHFREYKEEKEHMAKKWKITSREMRRTRSGCFFDRERQIGWGGREGHSVFRTYGRETYFLNNHLSPVYLLKRGKDLEKKEESSHSRKKPLDWKRRRGHCTAGRWPRQIFPFCHIFVRESDVCVWESRKLISCPDLWIGVKLLHFVGASKVDNGGAWFSARFFSFPPVGKWGEMECLTNLSILRKRTLSLSNPHPKSPTNPPQSPPKKKTALRLLPKKPSLHSLHSPPSPQQDIFYPLSTFFILWEKYSAPKKR